ncbi:MAG TPA: protein kinase [Polyangiaceae bacterium]|jgi:serine/threonine protein kinase/tetratricopeptide (TPR) repeat protein|nr:protein kinase [Polyangiaceae bacterium]
MLLLKNGDLFAERFAIEGEIAKGGMGTVFRAVDRRSGEPVALKLLHVNQGSNNEADRFEREAHVLSDLRHPGIVSYVTHGMAPSGELYLAMRWLEGETLANRLQRGRMSLADSLDLVKTAAEALAAAHGRGIVHRDLKPSNLFLRDGQARDVVLLDFGIARYATALGKITGTGLFIGTPSYMAPEQARSSADVTSAADIFSLGCVFYECLTGKSPFDAEHIAAILAKILFDEPPPVRQVRPLVPREWEDLLSRMLHKAEGERPRDASALLRELLALPGSPAEEYAPTVRHSIPPDSAWTGDEQSLVSVVLMSSRSSPDKDAATLDLAHAERAEVEISDVRSALLRIGAHAEILADGSFMATVILRSSPRDQARVAARAALALRERWPGALISVTTGRSARKRGMPVGEAVDRAVRLLESAHSGGLALSPAGKVLLDEVTAGLLDARFTVAPFNGSALLEGERGSADESRPLLGKPTPCVGREQELAQLDGVLHRCVDEPSAQAVLITAAAGMGKSRLRHEFLRRQSEVPVSVLFGYGDPLSAGSPYGILGQALCRYAGVHPTDPDAVKQERVREGLCRNISLKEAPSVAEFLGELCGAAFPDDASPALQAARSDPKLMSEQIEHALLDWLRVECGRRPVLLVLEDLHWGDRATIKIIEAALRELAEQPLFVLALARPEINDLFQTLWTGYVQEIPLRPLARKASELFVREVLRERGPSASVVARIVEQSTGNALFLEELIRAAAEGKGDDVPGTVLAMLQARLLRLPAEPRRALLAASIFGETFWVGAVRLLCDQGFGAGDIDGSFERLVSAEIVEKRRKSRFPEETELAFRHALARDAAYSLLSEPDRARGHQLAWRYLARMGESDAIALAEHARLGGDTADAITFYVRAAEQSLERNDLEETIARAERGVRCGAAGEALGALRAFQSLAWFMLASWERASETGSEALDLLPRGSLWWCKVAQGLFNVYLGQREAFEQLAQTLAHIDPAPEARAAYACAASFLVAMLGLKGARASAKFWRPRVHAIGALVPEQDAYTHGVMYFSGGWFARTLEPNPFLALTIAQNAVRAFERAKHTSYLSAGKTILGVCYADLADFDEAERCFRHSIAIAEGTRDFYHVATAQAYLAAALADRGSPRDLKELEGLASAVIKANVSAAHTAVAHVCLGSASMARGEAAEAELYAREAGGRISMLLPYIPWCQALLVRALIAQGRSAEAADVVREGLDLMKALGSTGFSEIPFRVAAAEALEASGDIEAARRALKEALEQIEMRAAMIPEAALKERFLTGRPENIRASELARAWLEGGE